jgi:phage gp45-like
VIDIIRKEIRAALAAGLNLIVETVTDIAFGDGGKVTAKGIDDQDIEAVVGYHFGFYSRPNDGATGVVVKLGGKGANSILIAFRDTQYELSLEKGEVGIANAFGASMLFKKNGTVEINGIPTPLSRTPFSTTSRTF